MKNIKKSIKKIFIGFGTLFLLIPLLYLFCYSYSYLYENRELQTDTYNFTQLEKVKEVFSQHAWKKYSFDTLEEFNLKFWGEIQPQKNCYYLSNYGTKHDYIFWMKLESLFYKVVYITSDYAYPSYDLWFRNICNWITCRDANKSSFLETISTICPRGEF